MDKLLSGRRLLIIEDSRIGYDLVNMLRSYAGAEADVVSNVVLARRRLRLHGEPLGTMPELVLIDYQLPAGVTGSALAEEMRAAAHLHHVIRVSMSARAPGDITQNYADPPTLYHGFVGKMTPLPTLVRMLTELLTLAPLAQG